MGPVYWLCIVFLFLFVCDLTDQLCRPKKARTCQYHEEIIANAEIIADGMNLIPVKDIELQCRKHHTLFECMNKLLCDAFSRLKWEPLRDQTNYICGDGKAVYSSHAPCWTNNTRRKIRICTTTSKGDTEARNGMVCRALTNFISCAEATVKGACRDEGAGEVLKHMATIYVRPVQLHFNCEIEQDYQTMMATSTSVSSGYWNVTQQQKTSTSVSSGYWNVTQQQKTDSGAWNTHHDIKLSLLSILVQFSFICFIHNEKNI